MKKLLLALSLLIAPLAYSQQPVTVWGTYSGTAVRIAVDASGNLVFSGTAGNAAAGTTGAAVPTSAGYTGLNVSGTLRGQTGTNPSGSTYSADVTLAGTNNIATVTTVTGITNSVTTIGNLTTNNAAPAATNFGVMPFVANAAKQSLTEGRQALGRIDLNGNQAHIIMDYAGNDRGAYVNASNRLSVSVDGITAAATGTQLAAASDSVVCATDTGCVVKAASGAFASGSIASGALASGSVASGAVASGAISSGAYASGSIGSGAVASGAIASGAVASGAYAAGSLNSAIPDPCFYSAKVPLPINFASASVQTIIASSSSNKVYICELFLLSATTQNIAIAEDATAACASLDVGIIGGTTTGSGVNLVANQGFVLGNGLGTVAKSASTNVNFCLLSSSTGQITGNVMYVLAP